MKYCLMGMHEKENPDDDYCNSCKEEHKDYVESRKQNIDSSWDRYLSIIAREAAFSKL